MKPTAVPEHIVCLALPAWKADYLRSTVELMRCLAKDNLVLYVDYAYTFSDCIKAVRGGNTKMDWKRVLGLKKRLRRISGGGEKGLYLLSLPPVFPAFFFSSPKWFAGVNKINAAITGYFINRATKKLGMKDVIAFNSFQPFLGLWWKIKNESLKIYYCYDDFTNVPYFKKHAARTEADFIKETDLLIVTSDELEKRKQQDEVPVEVVYNGVHFESFFQHKQTAEETRSEPKVIGYTGSIDNRIDIDLLEPVVKKMPHLIFRFAGKVFDTTVYNRLSVYPNAEFLPPVSTDEVPKLMSDMHLGIIPYKLNSLTAAIYPLKANEYLAMGLPVVMTPFASLGEADEVIYRASDSAAFIRKIEEALAQNNELLQEQRIAVARKADWSTRARQLLGIIKSYKAQKKEIGDLLIKQTNPYHAEEIIV